MVYPTRGPTIPIETMFAPSTERPPWARKRLWKRRTIAQMIDVIHGPKQMAERPVPVGWEQLPVTEGSFRDERMKMKPPVTPSRGSASRSASITFFRCHTPYARQGKATSHQTMHHCQGRNPSMICMIIQHQFYLL